MRSQLVPPCYSATFCANYVQLWSQDDGSTTVSREPHGIDEISLFASAECIANTRDAPAPNYGYASVVPARPIGKPSTYTKSPSVTSFSVSSVFRSAYPRR